MGCQDCPDPLDAGSAEKLQADAEAFETPRERAMAADEPPTLEATRARVNDALTRLSTSMLDRVSGLAKDVEDAGGVMEAAMSVYPELGEEFGEVTMRLAFVASGVGTTRVGLPLMKPDE